MRIYLDHNATVPLRSEVRESMFAAFDVCGNASSVHAEGRAARSLIEQSRASVAALVGAEPGEIIFVSSGTEASNMALRPSLRKKNVVLSSVENQEKRTNYRLLISSVEHVSVLKGHGFEPGQVTTISVDHQGVIDMEHARQLMNESAQCNEHIIVSLMMSNNETGVIQPVSDMAALVHEYGGIFHCDAVQAVGKIPVNIDALGVDLMSLSAHKIGGPQGVGALVVRHGICLDPLIRGGGQETLQRAGTENLIGIAGFGVASRAAMQEMSKAYRIANLRDRLEVGIRKIAPKIEIFSSNALRLPNTSNFGLEILTAENAVVACDMEGIAISSGAACSSGRVTKSHVLQCMKVEPGLVTGALRVSLGYDTTQADIDKFLTVFGKIIARAELEMTI